MGLEHPCDEIASPTSVPLPASPRSSRDEFDALVQLLTSDEAPAGNLEPESRARGDQNELRDADGRLDFSKIKNMFASFRDSSATGSMNTKTRLVEETALKDNATLSSPNSPPRTSAIPRLHLSHVPHTPKFQAFDSGPPPAESTPIPAVRVRALPENPKLAPHLGRGSPRDEQVGIDDSTSSLLNVKQALDKAEREVIELRRRCHELENLQSHSKTSSSRNKLETVGLRQETLSPESQAFEMDHSTANTLPTRSPDEIRRALELVAFVDELVWKRSRFGAPTDDPYGEKNVQALQERLELWERTVRTRRRKLETP